MRASTTLSECRETVEAPNAEQENEESTPLLIRRRGKRPRDEGKQYQSDSPLNEVSLVTHYHSDSPLNEVHLATMPPGLPFATASKDQTCEAGCSKGSVRVRPEDDRQSLVEQHANLSGAGDPPADTHNSGTEHELARVHEGSSTNIDITIPAISASFAILHSELMQPSEMPMDRQHALKAIKALDFAKCVLRRLLKTYGNGWELIVADNYRVFIDALIDRSVEPHPQEEGGWIRKNHEEEVGITESVCQKMGKHCLPGLRISDSHNASTQKRQRRELDATLEQQSNKGKRNLIVLAPPQPSVRPRAVEATSPQASFIKEVPEASSMQPPPGSGRLELTPNRMNCSETVEAPNAEQENEDG